MATARKDDALLLAVAASWPHLYLWLMARWFADHKNPACQRAVEEHLARCPPQWPDLRDELQKWQLLDRDSPEGQAYLKKMRAVIDEPKGP